MTTLTQPWTDPAELLAELADIDALTAEVFGADAPLRDRVGTLVEDWEDTTILVDDPRFPWDDRMAADKRQTARRGIA